MLLVFLRRLWEPFLPPHYVKTFEVKTQNIRWIEKKKCDIISFFLGSSGESETIRKYWLDSKYKCFYLIEFVYILQITTALLVHLSRSCFHLFLGQCQFTSLKTFATCKMSGEETHMVRKYDYQVWFNCPKSFVPRWTDVTKSGHRGEIEN